MLDRGPQGPLQSSTDDPTDEGKWQDVTSFVSRALYEFMTAAAAAAALGG